MVAEGLEVNDPLDKESTTLDDETEVNKAAEIVVDGKTYSPEDIRRMEERDHNLQSDYTQKTQKLAEERAKFDEEKMRVEKLRGKNLDAQRALHNDLNFFKTHNPAEWDSYTSELDVILGKVPSKEKKETLSDPAVKGLLEEIKGLKDDMKEIKQQTREGNFSALLDDAKELIQKEFSLASFDSVKDRINIFYAINNRLPSSKEVRTIVSEKHNDVAKLLKAKGVVVKEVKGNGKKLPTSEGAGGPAFVPEELPRLGDFQGQIKAGQKFFENQRLKRGG